MSQWILVEKLVATEEYRKSGRNLASELWHAYHLPGEPLSTPTGEVGANFPQWLRKVGANFSRWLGKVLVTSGERLLRFAG